MDFNELSALLGAERMKTVTLLEETDSTNSRLKELASAAPAGQVIIARRQTAGRGRRGRSFLSPEGGVYLSMLLRPETAPEDTASITAWTAVAVSRAVRDVCGVTPGIKWVNDLIIGSRKVCGILAEMAGSPPAVIIGVGLNVTLMPQSLPDEVSAIAGSLLSQTGRHVSPAAAAAAIIKRLDELRRDWPGAQQEYFKEYEKELICIGKEGLLVQGGEETPCTVKALGGDFSLVVTLGDGTEKSVSSGEVRLRGPNGYV